MITRIYDAENRFVEGGQTIRRDGMVLRSEKEPRLFLVKPDSHHVLPEQDWDAPISRRTAWIILFIAVVVFGVACGLAIPKW